MSDEQSATTAAAAGEWSSDVLKAVDSIPEAATDTPIESTAVEAIETEFVNVDAVGTEGIVIETTETVEVVEHIPEKKEDEQDKDTMIASLWAQVATLTEKVVSLEAKLALSERAAEANAAPKLVHANKGRAAPRRVKVTTTSTASGDEQDPDVNRDSATTPEPQKENAETEEVTTPQQETRKKIANMSGVPMFGGAAGFNPFANGASPTNVLLKSRSSVTSGTGRTGAPSEAEIADALAKFDEIRDWVTTSLGDDEVAKNATSSTFCSEFLKDGSVLCRLVSTLFPAHAVKSKPGKFLFVHKENLVITSRRVPQQE
ncbi:UNVERIFIED_CONTAM: hypothetical protein HDU68_000257 [Siphonaria sp. JEL0065]|nr:hypothetical protein HDU68_000257 [Siphonaria sp. JEL0065]